MALRTSKGVVGIVADATLYSAWAEPTVAIPAFDISYSVGNENYQRKEARGHFGKLPSVPGMGTAEMSFKVLMVGTVTKVAPLFDVLMCSAGLKSIMTAGSQKTEWVPWSTFGGAYEGGPPVVNYPISYALAFWEDGVRYALSGGVSDLTMVCKSGEPMELQFSFKGAYVTTADDATAPALSFPALVPPNFAGAAASILGQTVPFSDFTLALNNTLSPVLDVSATYGIKGYAISDRRPTIKMNPEAVKVATFDTFGTWRAGTSSAAITWGPVGAISANIHNQFSFSAPKVELKPPTLGERDGIRLHEIEANICALSGSAEGADFTITHNMNTV